MSMGRLADRFQGWWLLNAVLVVVLVAQILLGLFFHETLVEDAHQAPEPDRLLAQPTDFGLPPLTQYRAIVERPLFIASRRPNRARPVETSTPRPSAAPQLKKYQLTAVIITGDQRLAIIQNKRTRSMLRLRVGDELESWRVEAISADTVRLRYGSESRVLVLRRQSDKPSRSSSAFMRGRLAIDPDDDDEEILDRPRRNLQSPIAAEVSSGPEPADIRRPDRPKREVQ